MDDAEKKEYMENENCFIGILEDWCSRNEGVELTFFGQPDNLLDKTIPGSVPDHSAWTAGPLRRPMN